MKKGYKGYNKEGMKLKDDVMASLSKQVSIDGFDVTISKDYFREISEEQMVEDMQKIKDMMQDFIASQKDKE